MLRVIDVGEGFDRAGKTGMSGHVGDAPSRVPDLTAIAQRFDVVSSGSHRHENKPPRERLIALSFTIYSVNSPPPASNGSSGCPVGDD
jgi:hypothetical protein